MRIIKYAYGGYLFIMPNKEVFLWDGGMEYEARMWAIPYLKSIDVSEISIIISHWHNDTHTNSIGAYIENFKIKKIYTSGVYANERPTDIPTKDLILSLMAKYKYSFSYVKAGDIIPHPEVTIDVLSPHPDIPNDLTEVGSYSTSGNHQGSLMARFSYGDFSILMTGDRGDLPPTWNPLSEALALATTPIQSTIMQLPHHGSKADIDTPSNALDFVNPHTVIVSNLHPNTKDWATGKGYGVLYVEVFAPAQERKPLEIVAKRDGTFTSMVMPRLNYSRCSLVSGI